MLLNSGMKGIFGDHGVIISSRISLGLEEIFCATESQTMTTKQFPLLASMMTREPSSVPMLLDFSFAMFLQFGKQAF